MSRLVDRVLYRLPLDLPAWMSRYKGGQAEYYKSLKALLAEAQIFDITNVSDYFYASDKGWNIEEFTNLAPLFGNFWMEINRPKLRRTRADDSPRVIARSVGVFFQAFEKEAMEKEHNDHAAIYCANVGQERYDAARWICQAQIFIEWPDENVLVGPCGVWHYAVEKDLRVRYVEPHNYTDDPRIIEKWEEVIPALQPVLWACFLAQWLLHCHNVVQVVHDPTVEVPKLARANAKRGRPMLTFKTLAIEPMKKLIRQAGGENERGEPQYSQAQHVIRGHTKTYTKERPLFGKHAGTWFWSDHDAGTDKGRAVQKDYKVKTVRKEGGKYDTDSGRKRDKSPAH
jgi:hypothetical protein